MSNSVPSKPNIPSSISNLLLQMKEKLDIKVQEEWMKGQLGDLNKAEHKEYINRYNNHYSDL